MTPLDSTHTRPPIATAPLTVILLTTDAAADVLPTWQQCLETLQRPFEILLVRPDRPDATAAPTVFAYDPTQGMVSGLLAALAAAQHPLVILCTADAQYQPSDVQALLQAIDPVDIVGGFRVLPVPCWRRALDLKMSLLCRIFLGMPLERRRTWLGRDGWRRRWVARWIFGLRVTDPECPFRLYRRAVLSRIPLQSRGTFVHVEILAKANHLACLMAEVPVAWSPPLQATHEPWRFADEAKALFRNPDFGPPPPLASSTETC
jgi:glycosyltransferase involved in cell wall biosynthesis